MSLSLRSRWWMSWLPAVMLFVAIGGWSTEVVAQSRSLQSGPAVRRQLLFRSDRVELSPSVGFAIGGVYKRPMLLGASVRYHLTNSVSLGLNANVGLFAFDTQITNDFETLARQEPASRRPTLAFSEPLLMTDFHFGYVPFHGKFNLFGNKTIHFDVHLTLGVAAIVVQSDSEDLSGVDFGPAIGIGLRTFLSDQIAFTLRFNDYLYSSADAQRIVAGVAQPVEERFRNHIIGMAGVSIFFPGDVRVSR